MAPKVKPRTTLIEDGSEATDSAGDDYDVVLDDQLRWSFVHRKTDADKRADAARQRQRRFAQRWIEREDDDPMEGGSRVPGGDSDIRHLMANLRSLAPTLMRELPPGTLFFDADGGGPDMRAAHDLVRLDRARRLAFGYVRPPPTSLLAGEDGGVNTMPFRRRRPRPENNYDECGMVVENMYKTGTPRQPGTAGTECLPVEANQFDDLDWPEARRNVYDRKGKGKEEAVPETRKRKKGGQGEEEEEGGGGGGDQAAGGSSSSPSSLSSRKRQRTTAGWMLRQPADSAVHAALLHLPDKE